MSTLSASETPRFFEINKHDYGPWGSRMATLAEDAIGRLVRRQTLWEQFGILLTDTFPEYCWFNQFFISGFNPHIQPFPAAHGLFLD